MALKALMADALGGRATRRDDEDDVGKPERQPVADTLRSSPRQEGGERPINYICRRGTFDVRNSYVVNSEC